MIACMECAVEQLKLVNVNGRRIAAALHVAPSKKIVLVCHGFISSTIGQTGSSYGSPANFSSAASAHYASTSMAAAIRRATFSIRLSMTGLPRPKNSFIYTGEMATR